MNVKQLKAALAQLPDDMKVGVYESLVESTGMAHKIEIVDGAENCPYDKGDNVFAREEAVEDEKICFIFA